MGMLPDASCRSGLAWGLLLCTMNSEWTWAEDRVQPSQASEYKEQACASICPVIGTVKSRSSAQILPNCAAFCSVAPGRRRLHIPFFGTLYGSLEASSCL